MKNKKILIISIIIALCLIGVIVYIIINHYGSTCVDENNNNSNNYNLDYPDGVKKPVIYIYPKEKIDLSIKLGKPENITCSYPEYHDGWNIIASPDGKMIDKNTGRKLYSLYWEGIQSEIVNTEEGFVVKRKDIINFLEEKLSILGLNEYEVEEFIIYWLPKLQENEYNYIRFATIDEINNIMPLQFSIKPDTIIRVLMQYKPLDNYIDIKNQELKSPNREGFVVVEWGGTKIK